MPWLRPQLQAIAKTVDDATAAADKDPQSAGAPLLRGLSLTRALIAKVEASALTGAEKADLLASLRTKEHQFEEAANLAFGNDLQLGPGTPDGRPMAAEFPTDERQCAGGGDHGREVVSAARHAAQRQRVADGL